MKNPNTKTIIVHSMSKPSWNIISKGLGSKFKIARIPYEVSHDKELNDKWKLEAFEHATFISYCFNNSDSICPKE